jgi:hypothetical protein
VPLTGPEALTAGGGLRKVRLMQGDALAGS